MAEGLIRLLDLGRAAPTVVSVLEDPGIKRLLCRYPGQALAVLAPELVSWGQPTEALVVGQEVLAHLGGSGGFLDVALRFAWPGRSAVIVLIEHLG